MSDRSFIPFARLLGDGIKAAVAGSGSRTAQANKTPPSVSFSRGFEIFLQTVNKKSSKYEYETQQVIRRELQSSQQNLSQPGLTLTQTRDHLCRLVYGHMLGYDVSEGYIHAVKLAQQGTGVDKKVGYLVSCLLLHRDHELILLLINTIQRDLKSSNILDNMAALSTASQLVPKEMIPSILPLVLDKLKHSRELVRQKAVMCLYQFQLLAPDLLGHLLDTLQRMLYDKDPGVMAVAVNLIQNNIQRDPGSYRDLAASLMNILRQIVSHKLSTMFEYHAVPFPWLQIQLLRCLAMLGKVHTSIRKELSSLLKDVLQRTHMKQNISFAILYECIQCIVAIEPERPLLQETAEHVGRFLRSNVPNLKYIGVKALLAIVQVDRQYALNYQSLIVQSLENTDLSIQRKMYRLLYEIANKTNVEAVCSKFIHQLSVTPDKHWRSEVLTMVINMADRYVCSCQWQIDTLFTCVQSGGHQTDPSVIERVILILQKAYMTGSVEQSSQQLLVQRAMRHLVTTDTLPGLVHISSWVLGELCSFLKSMPDDKVIGLFTKHLCDQDLPYSVKTSLLSSLQKMIVKNVAQSDVMATKITECLAVKHSVVVKQRLKVLLGVCKQNMQLEEYDQPDLTLSFLDDYVSMHIEMGRKPYIPVHLRGPAVATQTEDVTPKQADPSVDDAGSDSSHFHTTSSLSSLPESDMGLKLQGVKKVWSKQGRLDKSTEHRLESSLLEQEDESLQTEEQKRHQELTSALFSGLQNTQDSTDSTSWSADSGLGLCDVASDNAGWKSLHSALKEPSADHPTEADDRSAETSQLPKKQSAETSIHGMSAHDHPIVSSELLSGSACSNISDLTHSARNSANDNSQHDHPCEARTNTRSPPPSHLPDQVPLDEAIPTSISNSTANLKTTSVQYKGETNIPVYDKTDGSHIPGNLVGEEIDNALSVLLTEQTDLTIDSQYDSFCDQESAMYQDSPETSIAMGMFSDDSLFGEGAGMGTGRVYGGRPSVRDGQTTSVESTGCESLYAEYDAADNLYSDGNFAGTIYDAEDS